VRAADRHEEVPAVVLAEPDCEVPKPCLGIGAHIDDYVVNGAADDADDLRFRGVATAG
jgi:hypothetical protein